MAEWSRGERKREERKKSGEEDERKIEREVLKEMLYTLKPFLFYCLTPCNDR